MTPDEIFTSRELVTKVSRDASPVAPADEEWDTKPGSMLVKRMPMAVAGNEPDLAAFIATFENEAGFKPTSRDLPKVTELLAACTSMEKRYGVKTGIAERLISMWLNQDPARGKPSRLDVGGFLWDAPKLLAELSEDLMWEKLRADGERAAQERAREWSELEWAADGLSYSVENLPYFKSRPEMAQVQRDRVWGAVAKYEALFTASDDDLEKKRALHRLSRRAAAYVEAARRDWQPEDWAAWREYGEDKAARAAESAQALAAEREKQASQLNAKPEEHNEEHRREPE